MQTIKKVFIISLGCRRDQLVYNNYRVAFFVETCSNHLFSVTVPLIGIIAQGSQVVQRPILNRQILPTEQGIEHFVLLIISVYNLIKGHGKML